MKKKTLATKLCLKKKIITSLDRIYGGSPGPTAASCICPPRTYAPGCTLGICFVRNTDGCPTTSNMCPTSPEVNCTIAQ